MHLLSGVDYVKFALNHMATPNLRYSTTAQLAQSVGCVGVEFRNDLVKPLFDSESAETVRNTVAETGQRILALAEIKAFNDFSDKRLEEAVHLIEIARGCGAEAISLIPRNDGQAMGHAERNANLQLALREIKPLLEESALLGYIEPLGFEQCSLRLKSEAINAIESVSGEHCFRLIHDTFHHSLSGEAEFFAPMTAIVHISGVTETGLSLIDLRDEHRALVDSDDRIGNIEQLVTLMESGYDGPVSFEPFSPAVHALQNPADAISESIDYIRSALQHTET